MIRKLQRELRFSSEEVQQALLYWLENVKDVPTGSDPVLEFDVPGCCCRLTSSEETDMALGS